MNTKNLEELLNDTDFSQDSRDKEAIKNRLLVKFAKGEISMKKFKFRPVYAVAAAAIFAVGITMAACGETIGDFAKKIVQQFTVGKHATFVAYEEGIGSSELDAEEGLAVAGRIGSDGLSTYFTDLEIAEARSTGKTLTYETDDGSVIAVSFNNGVFSYEEEIERAKSLNIYFDTINDVKPYLAFNPLMPVFVPDGFSIDRICQFKDENGGLPPLGSSMYLEVYYTNADKSQQIYMQLRKMNEETGFWASAGSPRYITINGHKGVVAVKSVHVEIDGVMYMIFADFTADSITQQDVIKMAETLK